MTRTLVNIVAAVSMAVVFVVAKAEAHPSWGIVIDNQRQVYFSDLKNVWKIDAQGKLSLVRAGQDHTHDINLDEAGNLYGAENSYDPATQRFFSAIWKMTPTGSFSYVLTPTENPPTGTSIWKDRDGNMYHVGWYPERELLVLKRAPNGNVSVLVGKSNAVSGYHQGVPYSLGGIAFGADGTLYFTHGANVSKLTTNGTLTSLAHDMAVENVAGKTAAGNAPTQLFGIAVDTEGNTFVADHGNQRVLKITANNQMTTVLRAEDPWFPTGVALRDGELYVLEYGKSPTNTPIGTRVRKLSPDGTVRVLATVKENGTSSDGSSNGEGPRSEGSERTTGPRNYPYVLIGVVIGVVALPVIVWFAWRRAYGNT